MSAGDGRGRWVSRVLRPGPGSIGWPEVAGSVWAVTVDPWRYAMGWSEVAAGVTLGGWSVRAGLSGVR